MSRCGCTSPACSCVLGNTDDFVWTGSGSEGDPFELSLASGRGLLITCTSATRPDHADGLRIFETDTGLRYFSLSGQWYLEGKQVIYHGVLGAASATMVSGTLPVVENAWGLEIQYIGKLTSGGGIGVTGTSIQFNGDSGANYSWQIAQSQDASAGAVEATGATSIASADVGNDNANRFIHNGIEVLNYRGTQHKIARSYAYYPGNLSTQQIRLTSGIWQNTAAITSVTVLCSSGTFVAGSVLRVLATSTRG